MRRLFKIIFILATLFLIFNYVVVFARNPIDQLNISTPGANSMNEMNTLRNKVYTITRNVGVGVSVIATLILGIKFLTSAPNERADIKKALTTYVIAAVVFFGAIAIVEILRTFAEGI